MRRRVHQIWCAVALRRTTARTSATYAWGRVHTQLRGSRCLVSAVTSPHRSIHLTPLRRAAAEWTAPSGVFVRFQSTPNDACYKFYVDGMTFLPPRAHTMMFDSSNSYQSPLAHTLLESLPMVEEVTVGTSFVTVRRVEEADAKAAARLFAMRFHGVQGAVEMDEAAAAARSHALQQNVNNAMREDDTTNTATASSAGSSFTAEAPIELGGFTVAPSDRDEQIDEAALQALIAATDWSELKLHVCALLTDHISSGSPHVDPDAPNPHADTEPMDGDLEVVLMIKELVATTIRPQLQDDGGDIRFVGFDPACGEMQVEMLGACRSCKSSKTTLVDLIERTTRHWIPEVTTVTDVSRIVSISERFAAEEASSAEDQVAPSEECVTEEADEEDETPTRAGTVQFPSNAAASPNGGYRVVREVKASAPVVSAVAAP